VRERRNSNLVKKRNAIIMLAVLLLCSFQTVFVQAAVKTYSANSAYSYWNGKKVGATTLGVWYDETTTPVELARIQLGVAGGRGNNWYDYPQPGTYSVTTDNYQLTLTAKSIWVDKNGNGVKDTGEPTGSVGDVYYELVKTGRAGSSTSWDYLVDLMWIRFSGLVGIVAPNPFDLIDYQDVSNSQTVLTVNPSIVNNYGSVRTRVNYWGMETGVHYITIECKTKATFYVWHEPGTKGPIIDSTLVYSTTITQTRNIVLKITVT
jgi:hypothetical protein